MTKYLLVATVAAWCVGGHVLRGQSPGGALPARMVLTDGWAIKSSALVKEGGEVVSTAEFGKKMPLRAHPAGASDERPPSDAQGKGEDAWYSVTLPCTVLNALTRNGVYPDMRLGLNSFRIPDASDEFNQKHDLAKYSYLPDKRNPWTDPYWYRTEFRIPDSAAGRRVWLNLDGINYRADLWLNGRQIADAKQVAGSFSRYRFDITAHVKAGLANCLAARLHRVDHPGLPDAQLTVLGKDRGYHKEIMKDVTLAMFIGYDCMPTVPDRQTGLWQPVALEFTGAVDIRHPFVTTRLPLPQVSPARLTVSAEVTNATDSVQKGVLRGRIDETGGQFEKPVELAAGETKQVVFAPEDHPALVIDKPRLWWPHNYGPQEMYHLTLSFAGLDGQPSDQEHAAFGIRQVTRELHKLDNAHGLRVLVNGQKIFCRGGYIQPEILLDWPAQRIDAEVRYLAQANLNFVYFEDIPNPPDAFLDACDRYGVMFGNCFYGCYWMTPGSPNPTDTDLLARGTIDIIKRYRNHPSLVLYMAMNEGDTRQDVYTHWRKQILDLDGTRLFIPSGSFPDYRKNVPAWIRPDTPVGVNDYSPKSYGWVEPAQYFRWVRNDRNWMFMLESGSASLGPIDSLRQFIPDLDEADPSSPLYPLTPTWAHHGANNYYKPYDTAVRRIFGQPRSVAEYCWFGHVLTYDQHRSMYEAANHRMWEITSGFSEWKVNACWPTVQWHLYDWFLRPMVSYYAIRKACEPLHIQLTPIDREVIVVNNLLQPQPGLTTRARVYDLALKLRWEKQVRLDTDANCYKLAFTIPPIADAGDVYFVTLQLADSGGKIVSDNFYWLAPKDQAHLARLKQLPTVTLKSACQIEPRGDQRVARVKVANPTDRLAFLVHLSLVKGPGGDEIVPVLWDDNYICLLPGQSRELTATFAAADLGQAKATLELAGWNVVAPYECTRLAAAGPRVKAGQAFTVAATIAHTPIDGTVVELLVDGQVVGWQRAWSRPGAKTGREIGFSVTMPLAGAHEIRVGRQVVRVAAE